MRLLCLTGFVILAVVVHDVCALDPEDVHTAMDTAEVRNPDQDEDQALREEVSTIRWTLMILIRIYQKLVSPQYGDVCNFTPSCSHFGFEAMQKYGMVQGVLMTADRLERCHYCAGGHYPFDPDKGKLKDPVEDHNLWGTDRKDE